MKKEYLVRKVKSSSFLHLSLQIQKQFNPLAAPSGELPELSVTCADKAGGQC